MVENQSNLCRYNNDGIRPLQISLTLIGKSWKTHPEFFSEISVFRGVTQTDFWKTHPSIFCEYLFSFCKISGHIWMSFPEIGLCHAPEFVENHFSTKCSILD